MISGFSFLLFLKFFGGASFTENCSYVFGSVLNWVSSLK